MAAVLLAVAVTALVAALGHQSVTIQRGEDITTAVFLAEEIRDMVLRMPLDSVLDLNDTTCDPAVLSTGAAQGDTKYAQVISAVPVSAYDLQTQVDAGEATAVRVTVTVLAHGTPVTTQVYYVLDLTGVAFMGD